MAKRRDVAVLTYNGVDGACAAAMALLRHPRAEVLVTSAKRVGGTLRALAGRTCTPAEVLVCGLGVYCPWEEVREPAARLRRRGAEITWFCGRGYLEPEEAEFARVCRPVFGSQGSNTGCVCTHLGLEAHARARALLDLAGRDPRIAPRAGTAPPDQAFWIDLIEASVGEYFKYQDEETYTQTIGKLAAGERTEADRKRVEVHRRTGLAHVLWGRRASMQRLRTRIRLCAEADEPVLIVGESGTGKEYVAHLVHERSARAMAPLIPVNCALFAGNAALANSTLFGHVRGAFTGAVQDRDGAFVSADSGILFLDELAELPLEVQGKLLRVLEDGWVTPEGSDRPRKVDVRIVTATNRNLPACIRAGTFRSDLYHRLDTFTIHVPALRDHVDDVEAIARAVLPSLLPEGRRLKLSAQDVEHLRGYDWPGNVRQLIKVLKRAACLGMSPADAIDEERALGPLVEQAEGEAAGGRLWPQSAEDVRTMAEMRADYAACALALHAGNLSATARRLDIAVNTLKSYLAG
ncbi:MAG: sigma 54-interacting transcriptional regulator [Candidatus Brocadiaceae bacterium]|nr:sigma 54-interacting transcriptional regulator [Candidatus Brocadiaceae bacterium]